MKIYEIMHLAKQTLNLLHASCIKVDDIRYLPLFDEFLKLKADGAKTSAAVYILAPSILPSPRSVSSAAIASQHLSPYLGLFMNLGSYCTVHPHTLSSGARSSSSTILKYL